jgi:hypothetical protein
MSTVFSADQTRQLVLAILCAHGWMAHDGTAVAEKVLATAVGPKSAHAYLRASRDEYTAFVLSGQYWSEGNDALGGCSILIPRGADEDTVRVLALKFVAGADNLVAGTYAMRLMRSRATEPA